ncbi:MAG TPA: tRNA (5-methylaminomethyl-2-thiouridine)(34)-methyltransferase MnmD [Sphingobacterium bovisgrunnientis]|jgi:tRNA U34 5-methylaminomethyl-2-thiouridine-forming methyltransferase MnmC|uniref:tRNA (5-methylaminomethyl-2-thiouridine)(34)-methyltransferase MnmD n=1 Tax=Sphingobacterium bovisgrunnientis TaxID=1874697 RepID=UPI001356924A|nr:tRNA (5-methylaminomethyl-2-thiouridine)(34)-methyltransferase MnmD [Sphingobacterium bovisgrunnientis]HLS38302.1 tRNA (5-methylaminomethyl-2-thiouridine)(34)-methyltransferase MnmD [Sphingobacterium bovisgrunnientis]
MDFVTTGDGSKTIFNAQIGENYHSKHGALQESKHVFLKTGLQFYLERENATEAAVLEIGFGTGLNFILTAEFCISENIKLDYCGIEAFPLEREVIENIGYNAYVSEGLWANYIQNYEQGLKQKVHLNDGISLAIAHTKVLEFSSSKLFDVIYFDAFAAIHQPEMWSDETLAHVASFLKPGGVFVTYAITGNLKRSMKSLGFTIEKAPGAPGKREMLRAVKL